MGRTIHYYVEDNAENHITDGEWLQIENLQDQYNSKYQWSCENLSLERFSHYPNWAVWEETGLKVNEVWRRINETMKKPNGMKELLNHDLIIVEKGGYRGETCLMSGFTKVRDDEYNASLVIEFFLKASVLAPNVRIKVHDEGDYLACPVIIQKGRMKPDESEIKSSIEYWKTRASEGPADQLEFWIGLIAGYKQYLGLGESQLDNSFFIAQAVTR